MSGQSATGGGSDPTSSPAVAPPARFPGWRGGGNRAALRQGLVVAAIVAALDQATKLWLLNVFHLTEHDIVTLAPVLQPFGCALQPVQAGSRLLAAPGRAEGVLAPGRQLGVHCVPSSSVVLPETAYAKLSVLRSSFLPPAIPRPENGAPRGRGTALRSCHGS